MSTWKGALAVWRYSAAPAASIFADALGDPNGGRDLAGWRNPHRGGSPSSPPAA
ncbi:MAG TPA: hypothetical protein VFT22_29500 [Kofleriaceae bacterium]|nr:hypothetical protein [Kofleriaceae bacterium]